MRVRPIGVVVLALMLIAGVACVVGAFFSSGSAALALFLIGALWSAAAAFNLRLALRYRRQAKAVAALAREGTRAKATIAGAELGSLAVNYEPRGEVTVELELPDGARRRASKAMYVPRFAVPHLEEALVLPAFVDPQDPSRFEIQW